MLGDSLCGLGLCWPDCRGDPSLSGRAENAILVPSNYAFDAMKALIAVTIILLTGCAARPPASPADGDFKPFPQGKISGEQWQTYHEQISSKYGRYRVAYPQTGLENFNLPMGGIVAFTLPSHPAHPAVVSQQIVPTGEKTFGWIYVGYFAGNEAAFNLLWLQYQELARQRQQWVESGEP